MTAIVVGIGDEAAGDDAVGLAVAREVRALGGDARLAADASLVLALIGDGARVVLVDAVLGGGPPGRILELDASALATGPVPLSSHGLGVAAMLELARALYGDHRRLAILGIVIETAARGIGLSPAVAAAVAPAAERALSLAQ